MLIVEGIKHCGHDSGNLTVQIIILLNIDGVLYFNFVIPSRCVIECFKHCGHDYLQYVFNLTVQIIILLNIDGILYFNFVIPSRCVIKWFGHFIIFNMLLSIKSL